MYLAKAECIWVRVLYSCSLALHVFVSRNHGVPLQSEKQKNPVFSILWDSLSLAGGFWQQVAVDLISSCQEFWNQKGLHEPVIAFTLTPLETLLVQTHLMPLGSYSTATVDWEINHKTSVIPWAQGTFCSASEEKAISGFWF